MIAPLAAPAVCILDSEIVSPLGTGADEVLAALLRDRLSGDHVTRFDASELPVDAAAEVHEDLAPLLACWPEPVRETAGFDRKLELGLACASRAERFHELLEGAPPFRRGIVMGIGQDVTPLEKVSATLLNAGRPTLDLTALADFNLHAAGFGRLFNFTDLITVILGQRFGCAAFQQSVLTACSASAQALGIAFNAIRAGDADVVIAGGADSLLTLPAFAAFAKLGVIQASRDGPVCACRPCDQHRCGTLLGEGAGLIVLASAKYASRRGLTPAVEVVGYGNTLDGYHVTNPDPSGAGMRRAMERALASAGLVPEAVDYVNLHGTGTRNNDEVELAALEAVFAHHAARLMASSTKDRHGHLIAAAGVMEAIIVQLCMTNGTVPRTVNLSSPVPSSLDLVMGSNREQCLDVCMSNSFAFGGINTSLLFRRVR